MAAGNLNEIWTRFQPPQEGRAGLQSGCMQSSQKPQEIVLSDENLLAEIRQGSRTALAVLVERHHSPLLGYLYRMTGGNRLLAEDLVQESFLRVLRGVGQFRPGQAFKPWLYAIASNLVRDHYKSADQRRTEALLEESGIYGAAPGGPEEALENAENARQVAVVLQRLPAHQLEVVVLRYYQDLSLAEIAEALDIPIGTVKSRLSLGLQTLKRWMYREETGQ